MHIRLIVLVAIFLTAACTSKSTTEATTNEAFVQKVELQPNESVVTLGSISFVEAVMMIGFIDESGKENFIMRYDIDLEGLLIKPYYDVTEIEGVPFSQYTLKPEFKNKQFVIATEMREMEYEESTDMVPVLISFRPY